MRKRILLAIVLLLFSCTGEDKIRYKNVEFNVVENIEFKIIAQNIELYNCMDIDIYDDKLIVLAQYIDQMLHIIDIDSGKLEKSFLNYGRGADEISVAVEFSMNHSTNVISIYDYQQQRVYNINVDSILLDKEAFSRIDISNFGKPSSLYPANENHWICYCSTGNSLKEKMERFFRINNTSIVEHYDTFPLVDPDDIYNVYQYQKIAFSTDKEKMVVGTMFGAIFEIFDVSRGIKNMKTSYYIKPEYSPEVGPSDKTVLGFIDLYATNNFIYSSYSGTLASENSFKNIAIFDWNSNPVKILKTKYNIYKICVDKEDKKLYAILYDDANNFHIGSLNLGS